MSDLIRKVEQAIHDAVCDCLDMGFGYTLRSRDLEVIAAAAITAYEEYKHPELLAPYVDEEHQGGSWPDIWFKQALRIRQLEDEVEELR